MENVSVTITGKNWKDFHAKVTELKTELDTFAGSNPIITKGKKAASVEEETLDDSDEFVDDEVESDDAEMDADDSDEDTGPTLETVKNALKKYAARGAEYKEKAKKLLKKFKVNHIDDLQKKNFAEVLKALK